MELLKLAFSFNAGFLVFVALVCILAFVQHWKVLIAKKDLPGPTFVWPFLGSVVSMVLNPFEFYEKQREYGPVSWNNIAGQLFVYTRDPALTKKIFANESGKLRLWLHMNAEKILGKNNIAFMHGEPHRNLRKELLYLFTRKALSKYLAIQEEQIRAHMAKWAKSHLMTEADEIRSFARELNTDTAIHVFTGNYMDEVTKEKFRTDYHIMTEGIMSFPFNFPGTKLYKAIEARKRIINTLIPIIHQAQTRMTPDDAVHECLLDEWMKIVVRKPLEERESNLDYAFHILDFLFASGDGSTLVWVFEILSRHPEVWAGIKKEQDELRPNDEPITLELLEKMDVTNRMVKELLRYCSPAVSVPHMVVEDFALTETYTVPKGTILFPSILWAHTTDEGYKDWQKFDIDRWTPARREESAKNFMAFGYGAHKCLGQEYAQNQIKAFVAVLVKNMKWKRILTEKSHVMEYFPTVSPADGCIVQLERI